VTIGTGITSIDVYAFDGANNIKDLSLNMPTIGYWFSGKTSITSVTFGSNVQVISGGSSAYGSAAFKGCTGITSINIPDNVTTIGGYSFYKCSGLTSVTIGTGVTSIGGSAFYYCRQLASVTVKATTPPTLGGGYVFDYNASNRKIYVPSASVSTYKSTSRWSSYSSSIYAMP
jgi:hypothetical protein